MNRYLLLLLLWLPTGCGQKDGRVDELPVIDVIGNLGTYRQIPMSEHISEVEYVPLETEGDFMVGRTNCFIVTDTHIFIGGYDHCYAFTREGKFISDVGRVGRGPGEWEYFRGMSIDEENESVYLEIYDRVFEYTFDGDFVRDFEKPVVSIDSSDNNSPLFIEGISFFADGMFLGHIDNRLGYEPFSWAVFDDSGGIVRKFDNHIKLNRESFTAALFNSSIMLSESIWLKENINDTLFTMDDPRGGLIPRFVFDFGRYAFPLGQYIGFKDMGKLESRSIITLNYRNDPMIVTLDNIYYRLIVGRNTGIPTPSGITKNMFIMGNEFEHDDSDTVFGMYDIDTGKTELLDRDTVTRRWGLVNDIDGGLSFWPKYYNHSKNELVQVLDAFEMKELLTEEYFAAHPAKDPAAHARLRELLRNLKYDDNPVIVIAKLKE